MVVGLSHHRCCSTEIEEDGQLTDLNANNNIFLGFMGRMAARSTSFQNLLQCVNQAGQCNETGFTNIRISQTQRPNDSLSEQWFNTDDKWSPCPKSIKLEKTTDSQDIWGSDESADVKKENCHDDLYLSLDNDSRESETDLCLKRPKNGFIRFSVEYRQKIHTTHPSLDNREVSRMLGARWRKMTGKEKQPYEKEFQNDLKGIREQYPHWHYAPTKILKDKSVQPLQTRLRPREKLKRKIPFFLRKHNRRKWTSRKLGMRGVEPSENSENTAPLAEPSLWVQCDFCRKWRRMPKDIVQSLPSVWLCVMNPDRAYRSCLAEEELEATMDKSIPRFPPGSERHRNYPLSFTTSNFLLLHREPSWT
ncbi:hypothetical protein ScPMuIL_000432 [Solemya velum]